MEKRRSTRRARRVTHESYTVRVVGCQRAAEHALGTGCGVRGSWCRNGRRSCHAWDSRVGSAVEARLTVELLRYLLLAHYRSLPGVTSETTEVVGERHYANVNQFGTAGKDKGWAPSLTPRRSSSVCVSV